MVSGRAALAAGPIRDLRSPINVGMWLERILIIWNTLSHDYMPSLWRSFHFTFWDWTFLIAPLGLFAFLFLIFVRLVPAVSMFDMRELSHKEGAA